MILGAGIYSVVGKAAALAGEALWLAFLLGAAAALLTGLSYAELATAFPHAGAEYVYLRRAVPAWRWGPPLVGSVLVLSGAATAATVTLAFGGYLGQFVPVPAPAVALALLALMTAVNVRGIQESARLNALFTLVEIGGLVLVIALGAASPTFGRGILEGLDLRIMPAAALIFFAFLGFEEIANLAEEARDPSRDVPRAILIGVAVSAVLYVLVAVAIFALATPDELGRSESPLADAVGRISSPLAGVLAGVALFATANTGLIALIATSRLVFGMARDGDLPAPLARTLPGRRTPWVGAVGVSLLAASFVPFGRIEVVASVSSFAALMAFVSVDASLLILRFRRPTLRRPYRVPFSIGPVAVPTVLGLVTAVALMTQFRPEVYLAGAAALIIGASIGLARPLWSRARRGPSRRPRAR